MLVLIAYIDCLSFNWSHRCQVKEQLSNIVLFNNSKYYMNVSDKLCEIRIHNIYHYKCYNNYH